MASLATPAASFPYPRSYNSAITVPLSLALNLLRLRTCTQLSNRAISKRIVRRYEDMQCVLHEPKKVMLYGTRPADDVDAVAAACDE